MEWMVSENQAGMRLDVFLASILHGSRAEAQRLIDSGCAHLNGKLSKSSVKLRAGDLVDATRPDPEATTILPEDIPLQVIYEDSDLLVINKPKGMVVHPAAGHYHGTVVNAALAHAMDLSGIGGVARPGVVHRLDKDTSGIMVLAKNDIAHLSLQTQIRNRSAVRRYQAIIWGRLPSTPLIVDAPIGRNPSDRKKMAIVFSTHGSRVAQTELSELEVYKGFSLVEAKLRTGRTHQIRVHCAYISHPVAGDHLYGGDRKPPKNLYSTEYAKRLEEVLSNLNGQALHAYRLSFLHPSTGEPMDFTCPLPDSMVKLIAILRESDKGVV